MAFFASKKLLVRCRRNVKRVEHTYNVVTTPITFLEISFDDIPEIPCKDVMTSVITYIPNYQNVCNLYDTLSVDKDVVESMICLYKHALRFQHMKNKDKLLYILKCMSLIYKTIIVHSPMHQEHTVILNFLDYMNFVISCY